MSWENKIWQDLSMSLDGHQSYITTTHLCPLGLISGLDQDGIDIYKESQIFFCKWKHRNFGRIYTK